MEERMAGVAQECFAKNCDKPAVGTPPLFCAKHERMVPPKATAWLRENHAKPGEIQSRKWTAMIIRAVAKIVMEENKQNLRTVISRMAQAVERDKDGND
jgi:hypothetical protein